MLLITFYSYLASGNTRGQLEIDRYVDFGLCIYFIYVCHNIRSSRNFCWIEKKYCKLKISIRSLEIVIVTQRYAFILCGTKCSIVEPAVTIINGKQRVKSKQKYIRIEEEEKNKNTTRGREVKNECEICAQHCVRWMKNINVGSCCCNLVLWIAIRNKSKIRRWTYKNANESKTFLG